MIFRQAPNAHVFGKLVTSGALHGEVRKSDLRLGTLSAEDLELCALRDSLLSAPSEPAQPGLPSFDWQQERPRSPFVFDLDDAFDRLAVSGP